VFDDHHGAGMIDVQNRHAVQRAVFWGARRRVDHVVRAVQVVVMPHLRVENVAQASSPADKMSALLTRLKDYKWPRFVLAIMARNN